ncbi:MAG TPA: cation diffusion facilitator family transporter [Mycobacteriales bacterium]|jgi:cation diffusion facilitator family transporter|nr:cation diffusion facilitator family transporter [Mycobacteriales bacterium]
MAEAHAEGHAHDHDAPSQGHAHDHRHGVLAKLRHAVTPHSHDTAAAVDSALEASDRGMRTLFISLAILGATAALQAVVAVTSHSVALLGDTLHNVADALTALPLGLAFWLGRRPANRRYTYGYGRAEDLAGIVIVVLIAASSALAAYEAVQRLLHHQTVHHLWAVALAALVGFLGNEVVARYRIQVGRDIGSAALVADGLHARTDGFTSLSVLAGAGGVAIGWDWADPAVGLFITMAILLVLRDAAREVYRRLMDAVDPDLVDRVDEVLRGTDGVQDVGVTRLRWIGHQLRAECVIVVDESLTVVEAHNVAEDCQHRLLHEVPRLTAALVHADPAGDRHHELTAHHVAEETANRN